MSLKNRRILMFFISCIALSGPVLYPEVLTAGTAPLSTPIAPVQTPSAASLQTDPISSQDIEIKEIKGEVAVKRLGSDQFTNIQNGAALHSGDTVKTEDGSCHLIMNGKSDIFLGPRTLMKIAEASENNQDKTDLTRLNLENGKLRVILSKLKKGSTFQVDTPTAIASVRGTVFFLNSGIFQGKNATQLYVDETHGGVFFKNIITGNSFTVGAFSMSSAFEDGKLNPPRHLNSEQRDNFVKNWENPGSGASQQFGIEEIPNPLQGNASSASNTDELTGDNIGLPTNDAAQDQKPGANGGPLAVPSPSPSIEPSPAPSIEPSPTPSSEPSPTPSPEPSPVPSAEPSPTPSPEPSASPSPSDQSDSPTDIQEKGMIREEIARIRGDQDFDHADANLARVSDSQTGKVFTDVFGNRVRTDQYIFHDDGSDTVQFLSLTARTGDYQNGVSSLLFGTQFNRGFGNEVSIRSLPWNDYMNVVKREDVAQNLGIAQGTEQYRELYEEYIVHEHNPGFAQGESALYPMHFFAQFANPIGDRPASDIVRFDDFFTGPFFMNLQTSHGLQSYLAQGKVLDWMLVIPSGGQAVLLANSYFNGQSITIGQGDTQPFIDNNNHSDSGSQTAAFAANFNSSKLFDINYYRTLPVNNDGNPNNDEHPSYFDNRLNDRLGLNSVALGTNHLIGGFIPINDQGQIIDQPGFRVRGARDLMSPNPLVNGGNYNLEVILLYGYVDNNSDTRDGIFHEDFRIDTIITPEIFANYPNQQTGSSSLFPPALQADDDDDAHQNQGV